MKVNCFHTHLTWVLQIQQNEKPMFIRMKLSIFLLKVLVAICQFESISYCFFCLFFLLVCSFFLINLKKFPLIFCKEFSSSLTIFQFCNRNIQYLIQSDLSIFTFIVFKFHAMVRKTFSNFQKIKILCYIFI